MTRTFTKTQTPQKIVLIETDITGHRVLEMLSEGRKIADNKSTDAELQSSEWKNHCDSYPRWTSTIVINEVPDKAFGEKVEYHSIVFEVPREYQGMKNTALVLDSSTINLTKQGRNGLLSGKILRAQEYPKEEGWYLPDEVTGIPTSASESSSSDPEARYLWRTSEARVGPVARDSGDYARRRIVGVYVRLDVALQMAFVEQAEAASQVSDTTIPAELVKVARVSSA